jgi:hypothetical protein
MEKIKYHEGDTVAIIRGGEVVTGTIGRIIPTYDGPRFLVKTENELVKVLATEIARIPEKKNETPTEPKREPIQKSEITITPNEFREKAVSIITEISNEMGDPMIGMAFTIFTAKLHRKLFFEADDD